MATPKLDVKYDFNWFMGGVHLAAAMMIAVFAIEFLDTVGIQREIFESIGKWGALIEDGYEAQREIK